MKNGLPSVSPCSSSTNAGVPGAAAERAHQRARLARVEPGEIEPLQRALAAQAGEQRLQRRAALLRPRGGEEQRALRRGRAHEVGDQLERRLVGPVQVVEQHEQRRGAGDLGEQRGDRVEEAQPLGAELAAAQRRRRRRRGRAELRQHDPQLAGARAEPLGQRGERRAAGPAAQHLHDRLVGREPLLVEAAVEDDRAVVVRVVGQLGGEPRLADPGLAGEDDEAARAVGAHGARRRGAAPPRWRARRTRGGRGCRRAAPASGARRSARRRGAAPACARRAAVEQPLVQRHRLGAGRGAQLLAQQAPQLLERAQRLGRVARRLVRLHQQPVGGLAERRHRDRRARRLDAPRPARRCASTRRRAPRRPGSGGCRAAPRCSCSHGPSQSGRNSPASAASTSRAAATAAAPVAVLARRLRAPGGRGGRARRRSRRRPANTRRSSERPSSTPSPSAAAASTAARSARCRRPRAASSGQSTSISSARGHARSRWTAR